MAKKKFVGKLAKEILLGTAVITTAAGVTAALAVMPGFGKVAKQILDWYQKQNHNDRFRIRKTFKQLMKERLVGEEDLPDGSTKLVLSERGNKKILQYKFDDLRIRPRKNWDGKWYFVIFDLPKRYVRERELWRRKLKNLGFYQLQKSVWINAHPCRDEIDFASEYLRISPHVRILEVEDFDGSEEARKFFFS